MPERPCPFYAPDPERVFYEGNAVFRPLGRLPISDGHALKLTGVHNS